MQRSLWETPAQDTPFLLFKKHLEQKLGLNPENGPDEAGAKIFPKQIPATKSTRGNHYQRCKQKKKDLLCTEPTEVNHQNLLA